MDILIKNLDPALEVALGRSNDTNNSNTGQSLTVEQFGEAEFLLLCKRHAGFWKQNDASQITGKLAEIADKLTDQDKASIDAIVASHAEIVPEEPPGGGEVIPG